MVWTDTITASKAAHGSSNHSAHYQAQTLSKGRRQWNLVVLCLLPEQIWPVWNAKVRAYISVPSRKHHRIMGVGLVQFSNRHGWNFVYIIDGRFQQIFLTLSTSSPHLVCSSRCPLASTPHNAASGASTYYRITKVLGWDSRLKGKKIRKRRRKGQRKHHTVYNWI